VLFNSFSFLASFVALTIVYYALPHRFRWVLLVGASVGFYALFDVHAVLLLLGVTVVTFTAAIAIDRTTDPSRRKAVLAASIVLDLAVLLASKFSFTFYKVFATSVGVSFYTLSSISYLVDVFARRLKPERHVGHLALYISFFPKLLAGPIERAQPFLATVRGRVVFSDAGVTHGLQLMLWGLFKKVVIADRIAPFVDRAYGQAALASPADLLLATYFFAFQLYCDFSGYSDIAIGASKVLGIDLMENFRRPYLSTSVSEFWARRWHLSLTAWFRDYVYIPLGGNRGSRMRRSVNIMAVFLLSGAWHGANWTFVVWGALNGVYVVASTLTRGARETIVGTDRFASLGAVARGLLTFHLILVTWVFFRAASVADALTILSRMLASGTRLPVLVLTRMLTGEISLFVVLIAVLIVVEWLDERRPVWDRLEATPVHVRWAAYYAMLLCLVVFGAWSFQQFVYMQF
jgi:D-alanyl-lipoteichoic acid acyltransferase DltB (MBOAT superfamily)